MILMIRGYQIFLSPMTVDHEDCKKDNDPDDKGVPEVSFPS